VDQVPFAQQVAMAVRAGRRARDMSQREFAEFAGLSKATIARIETCKPSVPVAALRTALAVVGLRLGVVVDESGRPWAAESALEFDTIGIVDRGGRQFPAHLRSVVEYDQPYWRQFRDEQAGYRFRGPWTFRGRPRRARSEQREGGDERRGSRFDRPCVGRVT
jgi:transcriptional regulator with XRE-family HTH domain